MGILFNLEHIQAVATPDCSQPIGLLQRNRILLSIEQNDYKNSQRVSTTARVTLASKSTLLHQTLEKNQSA